MNKAINRELIYMIKLVISPEYFGKNDNKNDIVAQVKRLGAYSVEIDENTGFVSAFMTVDNYEKFVEDIKRRIEKTAADIKSKHKNIEEIKYNGDYTVFDIISGKLSKKERGSIVFDLLMSSATYQVISGIPQGEASVKVKFYDKDNKLVECIDTAERLMI